MKEKNIIEYDLKDDETLFFLHIQKTAGTTLANIIENQFEYDSIYHEPSYIALLKKIPLDLSKYKLIRGHFEYWLTKLLPKKPVIITMLRKPLEHAISSNSHL